MAHLTLNNKILDDFDKLGIAFSGGLDSSVLLNLISDQVIPKDRITALHINHGINNYSDKWEEFCAQISDGLGVGFKSWKLKDLDKISEDILRNKRLEVFKSWADHNDLIITGHHLDDHIETVLFRLFRGTGIQGLEGIKEISKVRDINFYRPFLKNKKKEILKYAQEHNLSWVEDDSNRESKFSRNMIRNDLMPKIISRWPSIGKSIAKLSEEAKWNQKILTDIAKEDLAFIGARKDKINMQRLKSLSNERQKNVLVFWLNNENDIYVPSKLIFQILSSIAEPSSESRSFIIHSDSLNTDMRIIVSSKEIRMIDQGSLRPLPENLRVNWDLKKSIKIPSGELSTQESYGKGLDRKYLKEDVIIKARVGGERCKPFGRDKSQKIKNLFQEFEIPDWKRNSIPLIYINDRIAAVGDLWVCDEFHTNLDESGISIVWNDNVNK
ncbi:MAG: tRNA lysidine(34) synthetase TilS [Pseudomonadota bacterium]|nr:tRNA lysidine(34) synthetase TilS [Pseudomonadota bacterium]